MAVSGTGTGVYNFTASGDMIATIVIMDSCRWVGATAAAQECYITDGSGNLLWRSVADGPNFIDGWVFDYKWTSGVVVSSMNAGTFQLYEARR